MSNETPLLGFIRRALIAILIFGLVGTEIELVLLKHTDGFWQLVPVVLVGVTLLLAAWAALRPGPASLGILRAVMAVFLVVGITGVFLHFTGNVGYEKESNPGQGGADLYKAAMMGSTPLLAPGVMLQLGLIGLLYTYRHPVFTRTES
jgi:hypothetical protein